MGQTPPWKKARSAPEQKGCLSSDNFRDYNSFFELTPVFVSKIDHHDSFQFFISCGNFHYDSLIPRYIFIPIVINDRFKLREACPVLQFIIIQRLLNY